MVPFRVLGSSCSIDIGWLMLVIGCLDIVGVCDECHGLGLLLRELYIN